MKKRVLGGLLFVLLLLGSAKLVDGWLKERGHPGLARFIVQLWRNYPASFSVEPPVLHIQVEERDLAVLERTVEEARERGVILPEGRPYVPARVGIGVDTVKARLRIKGKMTDHVKGSKWSFRVQVRKDGGVMGMRRFSLQHPGTRNYLCEWLYHRMMKGEGVIALRYGFLRVHFNGEDLGVYAYEEHFGPELLAHNGRVEGPIFRFDPALYWQHRLNEMEGVRYDEPFAAYQAAALDPFGSKAMAKDPEALRLFEEASTLMDAFRHGRLPASEVFDVDRIARRHAILDLIGGHHSMDWSDVKFHYDPVLQRIEPVAYESFSAGRIRTLAGSGRYVGRFDPRQDLHDAYFNDEAIFRAYVHHLERVSRRSYLDSVFRVLGPALDTASAVLYREFPYKELDRSVYYHNQDIIRRLLDVPKGFHAYRQGVSGDTLLIMVVPVEKLPMEIHGLRLVDGTIVPPVAPSIVPVRRGGPGSPLPLRFVVPDTALVAPRKNMAIEYGVLGASVRKALDVFPHGLYEELPLRPFSTRRAPDMGEHPFVGVDEARRTVFLRSGRWRVHKDLVIPAGYRVEAASPLELDLVEGARIISRSPIILRGSEEVPIRIHSSDGAGSGLLVNTKGRSEWRHVSLGPMGKAKEGMDASVVFQEGEVRMEHVTLFGDTGRTLLMLVRSKTSLRKCGLDGGRDQMVSAFSHTELMDTWASGAGDDAMVVRGGHLKLMDVRVRDAGGTGLKLRMGAWAEVHRGVLSAARHGASLDEGSVLTMEGGVLRSGEEEVVVKRADEFHGANSVDLNGVRPDGGGIAIRQGDGNVVIVDGRKVMVGRPSSKR